MKITYALWQGSNLLAVDQTAESVDEILTLMTELNKLGRGFSFVVRKVETK
jgi:hypothetical protein